jgi:putative DNA primase/helicase
MTSREEVLSHISDYRNQLEDEDDKFNHTKFSRQLAEKYNMIMIDENIHFFNGKYYQHLDEDTVRQITYLEMPTIKEHQNREVFYKLKAMSIKFKEKQLEPHKLVVANGVLDLKTNELLDYSPQHITTSKIDVKYDENAKSDTLENFIKSVSDEDSQIEKLIYQVIAYCIYKKNFLEKTIFFYSTGVKNKNGSNGKSTLLQLIQNFIGSRNTTSIKFKDLGHEFKPARLMGKMVNIDDDMDNTFIRDTGNYKSIATGHRINVNPKGKQDFEFKPHNKLLFAGNNIPPASDKSDGFYRRMVIVPMKRTFGEGYYEKELGLDEKLNQPDVLSALLNKCLAHLPELLKTGEFTKVDEADELVQNYKYENEPVRHFLDMEGERPIHPVDGRAREVAYEIYRQWAKRYGYEVMKVHSFTKELIRLGYTVERVHSPCKGYQIDFYHKQSKVLFDIAPYDTDDKYNDKSKIIEPRKGSSLYKKISSVSGK